MIIDYKTTGTDYFIDFVKSYNRECERRACVITFGCQQNEADSERIRRLLLLMDYIITDDASEADVIILNTCAIRSNAETKVLSTLGRLKAFKKQRPDLIFGVAGCMAAEAHVAEMLRTNFRYVSFSVEPNMLHRIPELIYNVISEKQRTFLVGEDKGDIYEGISPLRSHKHRAWVSIMYGCNNFCSYCIVPYTRGRERSRSSDDIISECRELVSSGCREITLLGQNVNSYRSDITFAQLIDKIADIEGDFIIRFMTSHPKDVSDELISVMSSRYPKVAPHFHLPLQSGSDRILGLMNRRYTRDRFLLVANELRRCIPDIALSTDVIVGFPSETDDDFRDTLNVLKTVGFDLVYAFIYSPRAGTPAERMNMQVPRDVSGMRIRELLTLQDNISKMRNEEYVNTVKRVLVDRVDERDGALIANAKTENNKLVHFPVSSKDTGYFTRVKIIRAGAFDLFAEVYEGE